MSQTPTSARSPQDTRAPARADRRTWDLSLPHERAAETCHLVEPLPWTGPFWTCFELFRGDPYALLLDSALVNGRLGRYSFVAGMPFLVFRAKRKQTVGGLPVADITLQWMDPLHGDWELRVDRTTGDPLAELQQLIRRFAVRPASRLSDRFPLLGGAVGYLGYEAGQFIERLPDTPQDDLGLPDICFSFCDVVLCHGHQTGESLLSITGRGGTCREAAAAAQGLRDIVLSRLAALPDPTPTTLAGSRRDAASSSTFENGITLPLAGGPDADHRFAAVPAAGEGCETSPSPALRGRPSLREGIAGRGHHAAFTLSKHFQTPTGLSNSTGGEPIALATMFDETSYCRAVERIQDHIRQGDIYQACMSQRFESSLAAGDAWGLYRELRSINPAPFASFLQIPEAHIVGASPERFLSLDLEGWAESRPIKGTRPRGATAGEDQLLRRDLADSEKDRAENAMIVDLVRNDLGRVCRYGSVEVTEQMAIEAYATVFQMVSTIRGQLRGGLAAVDLIRACFPGGSMTGAPKIQAMKIIDSLEPVARGIYSGAIGYLDFAGSMDLNIVIRSFVVTGGRCYFQAGGAVVSDSDPRAEYQESLDKARALQTALANLHAQPTSNDA